MITIEALPLFEISGKTKMVNLVFHMMECTSKMKPEDIALEFINHSVKMNKSKGSIAMDDLCEKHNQEWKGMEALPTEEDKVIVRSFFMGLAKLCLTTQRELLRKKKSTKRGKESDRPEQRAAALSIISATSPADHVPGRANVDLSVFVPIHSVESTSTNSNNCTAENNNTEAQLSPHSNEAEQLGSDASDSDESSASSCSRSSSGKDSTNERIESSHDEYNSEEDSDFDPYDLLEPILHPPCAEDDELEQLELKGPLSTLVEDTKDDESDSDSDADSLNYGYEGGGVGDDDSDDGEAIDDASRDERNIPTGTRIHGQFALVDRTTGRVGTSI